jgi:hypothetical protein
MFPESAVPFPASQAGLPTTSRLFFNIDYLTVIQFFLCLCNFTCSADASGKIFYELNGKKVAKLNGTGQRLLSEAIRMIVKSSHK